MMSEILQLEKTNANDFKNEIVEAVTAKMKGFAETAQNPDQNVLLTRHETASLLGISLVTLWQWTRTDIVPAYRIGNKVRYKKSEIIESLQKMNKFSS